MIRHPDPEALANGGDVEAYQGRVLTRDKLGLGAGSGAQSPGPLLQRQVMVLVTREHVTIQLPAVKHLGWGDINTDDDLS